MKKKYVIANFEARSVALFAAMVFTGPLGYAQRAPAGPGGSPSSISLASPAVARAALQRSLQLPDARKTDAS